MSHAFSQTPEQQMVLDLMKSAVPERSAELDALWNKYRPEIEISQDAPGFTMDATCDRIRFDNKTMRVLWIMGFTGWESIALYSPAILASRVFGLPIQAIIDEDNGLVPLELDNRSRLESAALLVEANSSSDISWPDGVPKPGSDREMLGSIQEKATFDLVLMATAFVFLHELRHVMFDADGNEPTLRVEEEIACDVWARAFMTEKIDEHARVTGQAHEAFLQKRSMAMALGAATLHELTPEPQRCGSDDYPPIADRIHSMVGGVGPTEASNYWLFASCLLIGISRRSGRPLPMVASDDKTLALTLIDQLR